MKYLFDTYAWIEILQGTAKGKNAAKLLEKNGAFISDGTFAEIYDWARRLKKDPGEALSFVRENADIYEIYTNIWVEAAALKEKMRLKKPNLGLMDAILLAIQKVTGATIVTGDPHFKGLKKVIML